MPRWSIASASWRISTPSAACTGPMATTSTSTAPTRSPSCSPRTARWCSCRGEYVGQARGQAALRRLDPERFTGGRPGRSTGCCSTTSRCRTSITVAPDRQTAKGRFHGILLGGWHDDFQETREEMMPQQFMEAGIYENDYVGRERRVEDQAARLHDAVAGQLRGRLGAHHRAPAAGREDLSRRSARARRRCCRPSSTARPGPIGRTCRCTSHIRSSARMLAGQEPK